MHRNLICLLASAFVTILIGWTLFVLTGCDIQKTEPRRTGSVFVTLTIGDTLVSGARVSVDGVQTTRLTPALINNLSVGSHRISTFKPGFVDTSANVELTLNAIDSVALHSLRASDGSIDLIGAPDGTVLLMNSLPVDTVPVTSDNPTLFTNLGIGTYVVSAYAPGYATEAPSKWTVQLTPGSTLPLSPVFVPVSEGFDVGDLAPPFDLRSDWGNTTYGLQNYRGQVCLVTFFFYTCTACIEEFPYIAAAYNDPRYAGKVQFLGVDFIDPYSKLAQFRGDHEQLGITFPLLYDPLQEVKTAYGVYNCPANFIVDATGRVRLVQGGISEALLRQTLDDALNSAAAPTFSFIMRDTLLTYDDSTRGQYHEFFGTLENLVNAPRRFIFTLTPVNYPDSTRYESICTWRQCYGSHAGVYVLNESYTAMQRDTAVACILYNLKGVLQPDSTWLPDTASFYGDYTLDFTAYPADNTTERITQRLHLHDAAPGPQARRPQPLNPMKGT